MSKSEKTPKKNIKDTNNTTLTGTSDTKGAAIKSTDAKQVESKSAGAKSTASKSTGSKITGSKSASGKSRGKIAAVKDDGYFWSMSYAPKIDQSSHGLQMALAAFFTAVIIIMVRAVSYTRPMDQFYWSAGKNDLTDFFSYTKMIFILICAVIAILFILYKLCTQSLAIKRSYIYIPICVYSLFVLLSFALSEYKDFSLLGYNDRFEGTLVLLAYMIMLIYIVNIVNTEKNVKWILYPLAGISVLLSLLGISQALNHDFFRTTLGKMIILPKAAWSSMDTLNFTFENQEIYQTVYNINYVSFYLTLLIPLFGMLFIHSFIKGKEEPIWKKILWGAIFALLVFNLIGSASSGGLLGMAVVVLVAVIVLNKKILKWIKPVAILTVIALIVFGMTFQRWMPEFTGAVNSVAGKNTNVTNTEKNTQAAAVEPGSVKPAIDYIITEKDFVTMSINGNPLRFEAQTDESTGKVSSFLLFDEDDQPISLHVIENPTRGNFSIQDERFEDYVTVSLAVNEDTYYILVQTADMQWPFEISEDGIIYRNQLGNTVDLVNVPHIGWENNPQFGSNRGYIWSRTLPMMKQTFILGYGADTYCIYFPHNDYAGKYTTNVFTLNTIVDKPHNMYMGAWIGTGAISLFALLALWGIYVVQSFKLYFRSRFDEDNYSFIRYAGAGIFLGITGFLVSGLVNDSTVSVMPMFYGLLGTGIAINLILKRHQNPVEIKQEG